MQLSALMATLAMFFLGTLLVVLLRLAGGTRMLRGTRFMSWLGDTRFRNMLGGTRFGNVLGDTRFRNRFREARLRGRFREAWLGNRFRETRLRYVLGDTRFRNMFRGAWLRSWFRFARHWDMLACRLWAATRSFLGVMFLLMADTTLVVVATLVAIVLVSRALARFVSADIAKDVLRTNAWFDAADGALWLGAFARCTTT